MTDDLVHLCVHHTHKVVHIALDLPVFAHLTGEVGQDFPHPVAGGKDAVDAGGGIAGRVKSFDQTHDFRTGLAPGVGANFRDLVSHGVEDHRGVVEVLSDHQADVFFPALVKVQGVIQVALAALPHIRKLVHHQHAQLVADTQQSRSRRVVGHADGIEARLLEKSDLPTVGVLIGGRSQDAAVVMDAGAPELDAPAVEAQAPGGVQREGADAEAVLRRVQRLPALGEAALYAVKGRGVLRPERGLLNQDPLAQRPFFPCSEEERAFLRADLFALLIQDAAYKAQLFRAGAEVHRLGLDAEYSPVLICVFGADLNAVRLDIDHIRREQIYVPVDAAAGVPAGIGHAGVFDLHADLVVPGVQPGRQIHIEGRVAVGLAPGQLLVDIDHRAAVDALQLEDMPARKLRLLQVQELTVGIVPPAAVAGVSLVRAHRIRRAFDHGVMGQRHVPGVFRHTPYQGEGVPIRPELPSFIPFDLFHSLFSPLPTSLWR